MKTFLWFIRILWIIAIPVIIISCTVNIVIGSLGLYKYGFAAYDISRVTNISDAKLEEAAKMMVNYLGGRSDTPQIKVNTNGKEAPLYNEKELKHLADVRKITDIFRILQIISIIVIIVAGAFLFWKNAIGHLLNGLTIGTVITLSLTGILITWSLVDFSSMFYLFHILSFDNDLWLLDPTKDYLIMMFPEGFFYDAALFIVGAIIIEAVVLLVAALILKKIFIVKPAVPAKPG